jgi:hypothetical protein
MAHAYEQGTNYRIPSPLAPPTADEYFIYTVPAPAPPPPPLPLVAEVPEEQVPEPEPVVAVEPEAPVPPQERPDKMAPVVAIAGKVKKISSEEPQVQFSGCRPGSKRHPINSSLCQRCPDSGETGSAMERRHARENRAQAQSHRAAKSGCSGPGKG